MSDLKIPEHVAAFRRRVMEGKLNDVERAKNVAIHEAPHCVALRCSVLRHLQLRLAHQRCPRMD
jgi:hypothetical protein